METRGLEPLTPGLQSPWTRNASTGNKGLVETGSTVCTSKAEMGHFERLADACDAWDPRATEVLTAGGTCAWQRDSIDTSKPDLSTWLDAPAIRGSRRGCQWGALETSVLSLTASINRLTMSILP